MRRFVIVLVLLSSAIACAGGTPTFPGQGQVLQTLQRPATPPLPAGVPPSVSSMLLALAQYMVTAYAETRDMLSRNPHLAGSIQAKMTMLESPTLIDEIFASRRWVMGTAATSVGGPIPVTAVFPLEVMRTECEDVVRMVEGHLPILVEWFDEAFPTGGMKIWYGFTVGMTGGGGAMYVVDRATALQRQVSLPYEAVLAHEAAHSYIGNEALTQFLELYTYNVSRGAGVDPLSWEERRGWTPDTPTTFGVTHVLDIYHRVGFDAMRRAYRAVRPMRPAYGQPLDAFVIATFANEVPEEHRDYVRAKLAAIIA